MSDLRVARSAGDRHADAISAHHGNEIRRAETVVSNLNDVAQRAALCFPRQKLQKRLKVGRIKFLGRQELSINGTELVLEFHHAAGEESLDRFAGLGEHRAIHGVTWRLDRKD